MIALLFARPEESRDFSRLLGGARRVDAGGMPARIGMVGSAQVAVCHTGIGPTSAERVARAAVRELQPGLVISAGFAGGLSPMLRVGDVVVDWRGKQWIGSELPERCFAGPVASHWGALETVAAKATLAVATRALAVDMESDAIAAVCAEGSVPMIAVRAISDAAEESLPVPLPRWFDLARQRPRPIALLAFLAAHPSRVLPFVRFVRQLPRVRAALAQALAHIVPEAPKPQPGRSFPSPNPP
jgi:adenosylhomocysteine nucleosidase